MQRTISGPDKDHLSIDEVAAYTGLGSDLLRELIAAGKFPPGVKFTAKTIVWNWLDVVAYMHLSSKLDLTFQAGSKRPKGDGE